ncbi:type I polyketide synthase [Nocardia abscessus]|uniref:type I polyketide synthase n=1 Tax=Nocardia abscessus TaxID=120957 RepID=UPI002453B782|nr:type I polyketide synthase [Nocardia abscessus]
MNRSDEPLVPSDRLYLNDFESGAVDGERRLIELIRDAAARAIGNERAAIPVDRAFWDSGLGSLAGVRLANLLAEALDVSIEANAVFEYPTPRALAEHLRSVLTASDAAASGITEATLHATLAAIDEPLAIVGMSCRLPGAVASPDDLWRLVTEERSAVSPFPTNRSWDLDNLFDPDPDRAGTCYVRHGGFLADADMFDAAFFGISPREAVAMDPQQRLVLEAAWEVLEHARIDPTTLRATPTGVYLGVSTFGYDSLPQESDTAGRFVGASDSFAVTSGRVAYTFGFEGPALTVDTACSSSLVALHLAGQALRAGECSLAIAGGVTVLCTPQPFVQFSRQRALAPDARCKAFAAGADGTVWGEGVAMLLVERLTDARRRGHRVLAVVRGTAVNQDGRSNGLTAPHGPAQRRVIRQALANAALTPNDIDMVEAHGTGTKLGDPIEAQALMAVYGRDRTPERPLWLGSVKSNLTHTVAAAGIAGIIKTVQAMRHGVLPRTLHVDRPAPLDWSAGGLSLLTETRPWPELEAPRRAGVSSFGISGTNAHVILEEAREPDGDTGSHPVAAPEPGTVPWVVSGRGALARRAQADRLVGHLRSHPDLSVVDVAYTLATTRTAFPHRAVVLAADRDGYLEGLEAIAEERETPGVILGTAVPDPKIAFLFTGQGAQRAGMGRELYDRSPVFAEALDAVCAYLDPLLDRPLLEVVFADEGSPDAALLARTDFTQPALLACELALFRLLEVAGLRPDVLFGHSVGELAAAHIAGVLSLADTCALVAARGRLMQELPAGGAMLAVAASEQEAAEALAGHEHELAIAAVNGPRAVVLSGDEAAIADQAAYWEASGRRTQRLRVGHAFHSPRMGGMLERFRQVAEKLSYAPPRIPLISNVTGAPLTAEQACSPAYWVRHVRETVRFHDGLRRMDADGVTGYLEVGPDGVLTALVRDCLPEAQSFGPVLSRRRPEASAVATALARAHVHGVTLHWDTLFASLRPRQVDLPTYAFQRHRYWPEGTVVGRRAVPVAPAVPDHPWLTAPVELAGSGGHVYSGRLAPRTDPWLSEHAIGGTAVFPGTALLELASHAGERLGCGRLDELILHAPLPVPDEGEVLLQVEVGPPGESRDRQLTIYARPEADLGVAEPGSWTRHATGTVAPFTGLPSESSAWSRAGDAPWPPPNAVPIPLNDLYRQLGEREMDYGLAFRGLRAAWQLETDVYVEASLPEGLPPSGFGVHPALLDAVLHATRFAVARFADGPAELWLPFSWSGVDRYARGVSVLRARLRAGRTDTKDSIELSLTVTDEAGRPVIEVASLVLRPAMPAAVGGQSAAEALFRLDWVRAPAPDAGAWSDDCAYAVLGPDRLLMAAALEANGHSVVAVPDWSALVLSVAGGTPIPDVVLVPCVGVEADSTLIQRTHAMTAQVLHLLRCWLADDRFAGTRLVVVTRDAVAATSGDRVKDLACASIWGLVRVAQTENPERILLLDVEKGADLPQALAAARASGQPQSAFRAHALHVPRLARADTATAELRRPTGGSPWRLAPTEPGDLDRWTVESLSSGPLRAGQVRIAVRAAGINFRDVMIALDIYPGEATMGREVAGVVTEVDPGVTRFVRGDRVMGVVSGGFASSVDADHRALVLIPADWSFAQAAGFPIAFLTAHYALLDLAGLKRGESVLIHSAAGGVGMAALQLARHIGAEAYATASPGKWEALYEQGIDERHVASSRTLEFEEHFRRTTDGRGVDVVLNALSREFTDASLRLLRQGGRFVEMGKTDVRDPRIVTAEHPGVSYQPFDLGDLEPYRLEQMFAELLALIEDGAIRPLPIHAWDIRQAGEALRFVSQARHTGKVVLTVPVEPNPQQTVLITGGTGTLGTLLARHLATAHGMRRLVLAGRSGTTAETAPGLATELAAVGAEIRIVSCDVSVREEVAALLASIPSLGSVVHAAGAVDDGTLESLDTDKLERVLRPKLDAAVHLHELTRHLDLAEFIMFSSGSGLFGNAGQANYAAANTFLDAMAYHRRAEGLPACSVAWGLWAPPSRMSSGVDRIRQQRLTRGGVVALSVTEGLALFDAARGSARAMTAAMRWNLAALRSSHLEQPLLLRDLVPRRGVPVGVRAHHDSASSWAQRLAGAGAAEQDRLVLELVLTQAADVLGYSAGHTVAPDEKFQDLGFDSLTTVELRNRLNRIAGLHLGTDALFDHPNSTALARQLSKELLRSGTTTAPASQMMEVPPSSADAVLEGFADR